MMRAWALLVLIAAGAASCGGKVVIDFPGVGGGGSGAAGSSTGSSSGVSGAGGGGGALPGCIRCSEYLGDPPLGTDHFCASSQVIYDAMHGCICETTCASVCAKNICEGFSLNIDCSSCIDDTSMAGCGVQYNACWNDT